MPQQLAQDVMLLVLAALPPSQARPVCRAAASAFGAAPTSPAEPELPLWLLQAMWPQIGHDLRREQLLRARAAVGDEAGVAWLLDAGCPAPPALVSVAAGAGQLGVVQLLRARGLRWDTGTTAAAARGGHTHVLVWMAAQQPPCPVNGEALWEAAGQGQLEAIKLLRSLRPPAPWDEATILAAAIRGDLDLLKWLRAQEPPCPWAPGTRGCASGKPEVARWLKSVGAP